ANRRGGSRGSGPDVSFRTKTRRREGEERACQVVRFLPALRGGSGMPSSALRAARRRRSGDIALATTAPPRPQMGPQGTPCALHRARESCFASRAWWRKGTGHSGKEYRAVGPTIVTMPRSGAGAGGPGRRDWKGADDVKERIGT